MFKPAFVEVIIAFTTKEGGTLLNLIKTKFNKLIFTPESWAVNQRLTGNKYNNKKSATVLPIMIKIKLIDPSMRLGFDDYLTISSIALKSGRSPADSRTSA